MKSAIMMYFHESCTTGSKAWLSVDAAHYKHSYTHEWCVLALFPPPNWTCGVSQRRHIIHTQTCQGFMLARSEIFIRAICIESTKKKMHETHSHRMRLGRPAYNTFPEIDDSAKKKVLKGKCLSILTAFILATQESVPPDPSLPLVEGVNYDFNRGICWQPGCHSHYILYNWLQPGSRFLTGYILPPLTLT